LLNLLIIALGVLSYRRGGRGKLVALAVAWFYISLAPVSNIIPIPGSMMGERFVYFTFAGVLPLLAGALRIEKGSIVQKAAVILGVGVFAAFIAADVSRTSLWENNRKFFTLLSKQEPYDHAVQIRMAQEEIESGETQAALSRIERILHGGITSSLTDHEMQPHYWYGRALLDSGRFNEAYREFSIVVTMSPKSFKDVSLFLAESAAKSGNIAEARRLLEHEAASSPDNDNVWNGLGNIQLMTADLPAAISSYRHALTINPKNGQAAANLEHALQATTGQAPKPR
jgi:tetratricopeptide (TPR) repeat protein